MQGIENIAKTRAKELLENGEVSRVIGWKKGDFCYDVSPATFTKENIDEFIYTEFCGANLSKYLIGESKKEGKILVFLKPCDTYSFNQLVQEHRIKRENIYVIGIECRGKIDADKLREKGIDGVLSCEANGDELTVKTLYGEQKISKEKVLLEKCACCKGKKHAVYDELIGEEIDEPAKDRFGMVEKLESMTEDERFAFWKAELSKCIRCNACRNVCPACSCTKCVFDNPDSNISSKSNADTFEEKMFHIVRAWHVAGRCTDCGECSRVCPQGIPLHLINRKFIKDMNGFYGEYQAGADTETKAPLNSFDKEDREPSEFDKENN